MTTIQRVRQAPRLLLMLLLVELQGIAATLFQMNKYQMKTARPTVLTPAPSAAPSSTPSKSLAPSSAPSRTDYCAIEPEEEDVHQGSDFASLIANYTNGLVGWELSSSSSSSTQQRRRLTAASGGAKWFMWLDDASGYSTAGGAFDVVLSGVGLTFSVMGYLDTTKEKLLRRVKNIQEWTNRVARDVDAALQSIPNQVKLFEAKLQMHGYIHKIRTMEAALAKIISLVNLSPELLDDADGQNNVPPVGMEYGNYFQELCHDPDYSPLKIFKFFYGHACTDCDAFGHDLKKEAYFLDLLAQNSVRQDDPIMDGTRFRVGVGAIVLGALGQAMILHVACPLPDLVRKCEDHVGRNQLDQMKAGFAEVLDHLVQVENSLMNGNRVNICDVDTTWCIVPGETLLYDVLGFPSGPSWVFDVHGRLHSLQNWEKCLTIRPSTMTAFWTALEDCALSDSQVFRVDPGGRIFRPIHALEHFYHNSALIFEVHDMEFHVLDDGVARTFVVTEYPFQIDLPPPCGSANATTGFWCDVLAEAPYFDLQAPHDVDCAQFCGIYAQTYSGCCEPSPAQEGYCKFFPGVNSLNAFVEGRATLCSPPESGMTQLNTTSCDPSNASELDTVLAIISDTVDGLSELGEGNLSSPEARRRLLIGLSVLFASIALSASLASIGLDVATMTKDAKTDREIQEMLVQLSLDIDRIAGSVEYGAAQVVSEINTNRVNTEIDLLFEHVDAMESSVHSVIASSDQENLFDMYSDRLARECSQAGKTPHDVLRFIYSVTCRNCRALEGTQNEALYLEAFTDAVYNGEQNLGSILRVRKFAMQMISLLLRVMVLHLLCPSVHPDLQHCADPVWNYETEQFGLASGEIAESLEEAMYDVANAPVFFIQAGSGVFLGEQNDGVLVLVAAWSSKKQKYALRSDGTIGRDEGAVRKCWKPLWPGREHAYIRVVACDGVNDYRWKITATGQIQSEDGEHCIRLHTGIDDSENDTSSCGDDDHPMCGKRLVRARCDGWCGHGYRGNGRCPKSHQCCNMYGACGGCNGQDPNSLGFCGGGNFGNSTCSGSGGRCCSPYGWCGRSLVHCIFEQDPPYFNGFL